MTLRFHCNYQFSFFIGRNLLCFKNTCLSSQKDFRTCNSFPTKYEEALWLPRAVIKLRMWAGVLPTIKDCSVPPRKIGQQLSYYVS